jgi:hypothetical protein
LSDNELFKEAEVKNLSNQLQMMSSDGSKMSISDIVRIAREEGFNDKSIKAYLKSEGFKAAEINQAMTIHLDMFTEMPDSFINVFNGSEQGINMFNDIKESLNNWLTSRWGKGKSFAEYRAKAMEILAKQPLFDKQSDINKQKLMSGMDQVIGRRKAKDASAPIKSIKDTVELIKKNNWEADIPGAKKSLLSAIKTLAGTKLHKEKLSKIKGLINKLDSKNHKKSIDQIDTVLKEIIEDDKAITTEMNVKLRALEKKMSLFSKMEDYLKMKTEGSQAIKDIDALAKALVRSIGEDNRGIVDKMQALLKDGINTKNAKEKIPELADLLSDLIFEQKTKKDEISQLNNVIKNLREKREQRRLQAKQLKEIKAKIVRDIRSATIALRDLGVKDYTYTDLQRLTAKVRDANINNIDKVAAQVANIFSNVEERGRKKKLKDILSFIKKAAEAGKRSGRLIGKGSISADGQAFFDAANQFVELLKNNEIDEIKTALDLKDMLDSMTKEDRQDALDNDDSVKSSKFLIERLDKIMGDNQLMAGIPDMLMGLGTMTLEQLNFLDADLKLNRMAFAIQLASKKAIEKAAREELKQKASEQIQEQYEMLYKEVDEDGETVMKPKNSDELSRINKPFKKIFKEEGAREMFRAMVDRFKLSNIMVDFAGHLTAVCSVLDNLPEGKAFFTENIVKRLNRAQARFTKGLQEQREILDSFAASINPNYKYDDIKKKIFNTKDLKIKDDTYSGDQMLRIYALLKNNVQRDKLIKENGLTKDDIDNINNSLDPDVKAFADMVIDYLSNDYYDQINNVYRDVNNINLPKIDNYFPTQTVSEKATVSENIKALAEMATGKFSAQGESFLKQRTSVKGPVAIYKGTSGIPYTFTDSLDGLMGGSERFKAYAKDAKILNSLLNSTDISNLMKMTGLKDLVNNFINNAISPVVNDDRKMDALRFLFSRYIGVALSWKFWQIPKQASSFVMAFPEYQLAATEGLPPIVKLLPNLVAFLGESALTYVNLRKNFKEAYNTSPMFRERVQRFKRSGFSALETSITEKQAKSKIERALVKIEKIGSSATFMGDIMGVMGYWTNYKRDIANGMDPKLALEKFEDYNKTQQTQRDTEINKWQLKGRQNPAWMAITTFASTPFLMQSIILESVSSMSKMAKKEKGFKKMMSPIKSLLTTREGMRFIFALGVGNAIFAAASNAMKMMYGDEEDEEDFYKEINKAATGYNTLASLPFLSQAVDLVYEFAYDDENVYGQQEMLNPLSMAIKEISGGLRKKKGTFLGDIFGKEKDTKNAWNSAFKYTTGINTDPMIGLYEFIKGEAGAGFKALGITKSYLPKEKKSFLEGGDILPEMDILEE